MTGKFAQSDLPWPDIPFILALARCQTFSEAADALRVDRTTVARRLDKLESRLNSKIFERNAGEMVLSAEGRRIVAIAERAEQELSQIRPNTEDQRIKFGKVRIAVSEHMLAAFAPEISALIHELPEVFLEFTTSDRFVDLIKYEADIVLRIGRTAPSVLHSIDVGPVRFACFRSNLETGPIQKYWARPGETKLPKPIQIQNPNAEVVAAIDGILPLKEAIIVGGGAGILPNIIGERDKRLQKCSENFPQDKFHLFLGCLPEQRHLHRIRIVMKHLAKLLSDGLE